MNRVETWDWKDPNPAEYIARAVTEVSGGVIRIYEVDTRSDLVAIVVSDEELTEEQVMDLYRNQWSEEDD